MTKVVFFKSGDTYWGFEEQGHTGYADEGQDILCSALSAMTMLIINAIEISYASEVDYQIDDKTTNIRVIARGALPDYEEDKKKRYAISGLIMAYFYQLTDLIEEYYEFLDVEIVEKEYDGNK